ncbi:DUF2512 family protein [Alkalihalobacillus sp. AL-G]|uniref:DUF2512 family protein n=1 Tax=Alkalihalobacillus sp. AL-G TaxID=2926399 RepID=UPI00272A4568|nr:DUF2512 family protein [Alkalihalobacillus sp. AL-G]WLD94646.1 YndM family protein [Alkalihalobacillus sp. AL-G]
MTSLLMKIIACPVAVIIAMFLFPGVDYESMWQPIIVGLILAVAGVFMEYLILRQGTFWFSIIADFVASVVIVYFVSNLLWVPSVTLLGAVLTGVLLAGMEYFTHRFLLSSGKAQKTPA